MPIQQVLCGVAETIQLLCTPLKRLNIQPEEIKIMVCMSLSMIPIFKKDLRELKEACKAKNMKWNIPNMKFIFSRFFLSGAINSEFDKQGRISITSSLKEYAGLTKDCVVIGVGDRLEIWSEDAWQKFFQESQEDFSDIAEHLFDGNLDL